MLTKSQVLDAIKKSLVLYKREILDNEYSTRKYVDDSISNINDLPLLSSICMKNEDGSLIKSGVNYLLDFSKIPVDDTKFYLANGEVETIEELTMLNERVEVFCINEQGMVVRGIAKDFRITKNVENSKHSPHR